MLPQYDAKLHTTLSEENDMFLLYVNGMEFLSLPYKYDLVPEGDKGVKCEGYVSFDDKNIEIPLPWNNRAFVFNIKDALPNDQ